MNKKPLVTVVIPCYNEARWLRDLITSLKKQTYPNVEILVIDDQSTDNSAKIARELGARVVTLKKKGFEAGAREAGFIEAKGDIIIQADADAYFPPNYVEEMVKPIIKGEADATSISLIKIHKAKKGIFADFFRVRRFAYHLLKKRGKAKAIGALGFKKRIFKKVGPYAPFKVGTDVDYANRTEKKGFKIKPVFTTWFYHADPGSFKEFIRRIYWGAVNSDAFMRKWNKRYYLHVLSSIFLNFLFLSSFIGAAIYVFTRNLIFLSPLLIDLFLESLLPSLLLDKFRLMYILSFKEKNFKLLFILPILVYFYTRLNRWGLMVGFIKKSGVVPK